MMEKKEFNAEVGRVLDLMINALYTNKDIFLRELISNASDACDKLRYLSLQDPSLMDAGHQFKISVSIDAVGQTLSITDTGIGMDKADMVENLGTIASSGTRKFLDSVSSRADGVNLIGQFGVGFYSAFMVADEVTVISRKAGSSQAYIWRSSGKGEFEVGEADGMHPVGTTITLKIKPTEVKYLEKFHVEHIIRAYSDHIPFPVSLGEADKMEVANTNSALWRLPKAEVTSEQYVEFFRYLAHQPGDPWMTLHAKVEGNLEYTILLFVPSTVPFDLFHPDRKTRVKLYIKRVFITEDTVKLVPQYLRFLRGIVDSEDLPLNISRESVQHNALLDKIGRSVVKRVLNEFKAKSEEDPEGYAKFWGNFGEVLKEGLCEHGGEDKELLLEICRFNSTHSSDLTSLEGYVARMLEAQKAIYFLTGENAEQLRRHPLLEGFTKRGIEVLLFSDHVDDFWINVITSFKDKELVNITATNIDLNAIKAFEEEEEKAEGHQAGGEEDGDILIKFFKDALGGKVKDVCITSKLSEGMAASLATPEGNMSARLERVMLEQKQLKMPFARVLEINPKHFLLKRIAMLLREGKHDIAEPFTHLIYDQACLLDGGKVTDPQECVARINKLMACAGGVDTP